MATNKSKQVRVFPEFEKKLMKAQGVRRNNNLCSRKEETMQEATKLLYKSRGFQMALEEIKIKPIKKRKGGFL